MDNRKAATILAGPLTPPARTLANYWMDAVERYGDPIALRSEANELTYRELDRRAQSLANRLSNGGLSRGQICGIYIERSVDCVISILAVTLTGGAWLPLDPNYETTRLRLMATDADIKFLVSNRDPHRLSSMPV